MTLLLLTDDPAAVVAAADDPASAVLVLVEQARAWLVEATHVEDVVDVKAKADAIRAYVVQARLGKEAEQAAIEIRVRAERRQGELLASDVKRGRPSKSSSASRISELGITENDSAQSQKLAAVDESEFEADVAELRSEQRLSRAALLRKAKEREEAEHRAAMEAAGFGGPVDPAEMREFAERDAALGQLSTTCERMVDLASRYAPADIATRWGDDITWPMTMPEVIAARDWLVAFTKAMGY